MKIFSGEKVPGQWITICPVDLGELYLHANWYLLNPRSVHLSSSISENATIRNRNSTGAIMVSCLALTLRSMDVSILPMMSLTTLLLYMGLIAEHSLGGAPYFTSMEISNAWLEVSNALTRSMNGNHVGSLWLCLICRMF